MQNRVRFWSRTVGNGRGACKSLYALLNISRRRAYFSAAAGFGVLRAEAGGLVDQGGGG